MRLCSRAGQKANERVGSCQLSEVCTRARNDSNHRNVCVCLQTKVTRHF